MNDYITLNDGTARKYRTNARNWRAEPSLPSTSRLLLNGELDITFGAAALMSWSGEIVAPVTAGTGWGTIATLRATLKKRQAFTLTDHYGAVYTNCHVLGPFVERSLSPTWDQADNSVYVKVRITAKQL